MIMMDAAPESPQKEDPAPLDPNGFLISMKNWDRAEAERLAIEHEVGTLTEDHWRVLEYVQGYFKTFGMGPPVVKIHEETGHVEQEVHDSENESLKELRAIQDRLEKLDRKIETLDQRLSQQGSDG